MDLSRFTAAQRTAICHGAGPMLVSAGPGSGKTTVLTHRLLYLTRELHIPEEEILVITFTRAAAFEMKERFLKLFGKDTNISFGTFHKSFWTLLRRLKPEFNFTVLQENEKKEILRAYLESFERPLPEDYILKAENDLKRYDRLRNEGRGDSAFFDDEGTDSSYAELIRFYEKEKQARAKLDFEDMQSLLYKLLLTDSLALHEARSVYRYFLVDEFQDINRIQYEILKLLSAESPNVFVVGDEDQSIYGFRGSDPAFLLHFPDDFPGTKLVGLYENFRSTAPIVDYAAKFIEQNKARLQKDFHSARGRGSMVQLIRCKSLGEENMRLRDTLLSMHERGLPFEDMAVLYRTHAQSARFRKKLEEAAIPYHCPEDELDLGRHPLVAMLSAFIRLSEGPSDEDFLFCGKLFGIPAYCLEEAAKAKDPAEALTKLYGLTIYQRTQCEELRYHLNHIKCMNLVSEKLGYLWSRAGLREEAIKLMKKNFEERERFNLVLGFANRTAEGCESLDQWTHAMEAVKYEPGVSLSTMHAAKGLEYRLVWCAGISPGVIPHPEAVKTPSGEEEERRVMYVAMTRAKDYLYLSGLVRKRLIRRDSASCSEYLR